MSKVIGIFSGKGGVGKTTLVANMGAILTTKFRKNVLIFDSNLSTSHLGIHFGLYRDNPITLGEVLKKKVPIIYAVYIDPQTGTKIVPAPLNSEGLTLTNSKLSKIISKLKKDYEMIILDCAPGLGKEVLTAIGSIDAGLIITTPDFPAVSDALKTAQLLRRTKKEILGIVVNRKRGEKFELNDKEIASTCGAPVISSISDDKRVQEAVAIGVPVVVSFPKSKSSREISRLSASLVGESFEERNGFFEIFKSIFRAGKQHGF